MLGKYFFVGPETVTLSFTTEILFLNVKMRTVLLHLKQDLKLSIQEMFQLILMRNILGFFKVLQYLIIDFHA